ncbi:MAG: rhodanese-like domain-containing protein [Saprospiraceae bacterium]|nr:rhodanese-like domain-containing protein [Saprospiraceae bacterium]
MKVCKHFILIICIFFLQIGCAQVPAKRPFIQNPIFDQNLTSLLHFSVPLIGVAELKNIQSEVHIFDAREWNEYEVSHIEGAEYLGYDHFDEKRLSGIPKDAPIVLYCSVGYRSEKIGEKLQKLGFSKVYNLYGSIFEWVNQGNQIVDASGKETNRLHTYNKAWSQWVESQKATKIW